MFQWWDWTVRCNVPLRKALPSSILEWEAHGAATIMDLLTAIEPEAVLFLGKCGGLKRRNKLGDLILPIAAIRGEGTSNDYFPPEVPAMPAFALQKAISYHYSRL